MIHDRFCQLGTDKDVISPDECWSCDWVQRIRDDERSHMGIIDLAYTAGVQAAREAVAALPHEDGCCSKGCACQTWDKQEPCDLSCNCSFWWMPHALAAIDALRGES